MDNGLIEAMNAVDNEMNEFVLEPEDYENFTVYDGLSEQELPKALTMKARQAETKQVYAHKVHASAPLRECHDKWEKGQLGRNNYNIRAMVVAQELTKGKVEAIFAAMPP